MSEKDPNIIYTLTSNYLAGEATADEKRQLQNLIEESEANRKEFEQLKQVWEAAKGSNVEKSFDVDAAWSKLHQRIRKEEKPVRSIAAHQLKHSIAFYLPRIAAALLVLISIYLLFKLSNDTVPMQTIVAHKSVVFDTLPDQSQIALKQNTKLVYPENFEGNERSVSLEGEAFFKVKPNPEKAFVVKVEGAEIRVLGTSFLVQAYDNLESIKVSVEEGRVKVSSSKDSIVLTAGQMILLDKKTELLHEVEGYQMNELYWLSEVLVFKSQELREVFEQLEKYFKIEIQIKNQKILNCKLTAKFEGESIDQIFDVIAASFELEITKTNNKYLINGDGCK